MALPEVGLQAVIENLSKFEQGAKTIDDAYDSIEAKAKNVEKATKSMGGAFNSLGSGMSNLGGQAAGLGGNLLKIGTIAGGAALAGVTALGAGIAAFATSGVNKAIELDDQMAGLAATMGKTKDEIAPLKQEIMDLALDPNLVVNTTQAADAIEKLAQNGLTMQQIIDGAAKSTVAMANATGADFTTAANIATGAMDAFNLKAGDLQKVADGITGVLVGTKFSAEDYSGALAQAGGIMGGLGVSIEDFNTVLAASASSFASGSDAGTSFKTLLQRLSNPTDEAKNAMEKYGISLFNAEGEMRPLSEVAQQLNDIFQGTATITEQVGGATKKEAAAAATAQKNIAGLAADISTNEKQLQLYNDQLALEIGYYGEGSPKVRNRQIQIEKLTNTINDQKQRMSEYQGVIAKVDKAQAKTVTSTVKLTEAQRAELATIIGGADAARTVLALSQLNQEEFIKLSGTVNDSGQAFQAAATRVDSLQGAFDIFGGIIEAIQIQVGDKFLPLLRQVTVGFTEMATMAAPLVVDFFGQIATGIGNLITQGQALFTAFQTGGTGGLVAALGLTPETTELIAKIIGSFTELGTTISSYLTPALEGLAGGGIMERINQGIEFVNQHFEEFKGAILGIGAVLGAGIFAALIAGILALLTPINLIIAGAALLGAAWAGNWGGIQEKTFAVWAVVQPILTQLWTWLQVNLPPAIAFLGQAWENYLLPAISAVADFVANVWFPLQVEWWTWVGTTMVEAVTMLTNVWMTVLLPALTAIWQFVNTSLMPLWIAFVNLIKAVVMKTLDAWAGLWQNVLLPAIKSVYDFIIQNILPAFINLAGVINENVIPSASKISEDIIPVLLSGFERIKTLLKDVAGLFDSWASSLRNIEMPKFLQEHSPSPFAQSLMHITEETIKASRALTELNRVSKLSFSRATIDSLLGVKRGVADTGEVIGAAADDVEKFLDKRLSKSKTNLTLTVLKRVFRGNADAILGATDREGKFKELLRGVNFENAGISGGDVKGAISQFLDSFDQIKAARQSLQQDIFIKAGRTAVTLGNQLNDIIKTSAEVLDTRVETLQKLVASGEKKVNFDGQIISATQAQKELNKALADQARVQQELVTLQQNEMRLNFLEKQLNLVETISKAGLNVKDVLGGLELGLNASIPDMIAATNKLVMAMINQVDEDLKISSPSKVMDKRGQMTGQGFIQGFLAQIPDIAGAMKAAISGPLVNAPLAMGGGGGTVINNYSLGGNTISNGMDEATFEARVLGVIRRNLR